MHTHMYTLTMAKIMQTDRQTDKQTDRHRHTHRYIRAHTYVLMLALLNHRSRNYIHLSVGLQRIPIFSIRIFGCLNERIPNYLLMLKIH